jgi:hypothetical protein
MGDVFGFECDLDKNQPEGKRSGLTVHDDGEHIVFGLSENGGDNREIYLTPDRAGHLATLLEELAGTDQADDADDDTDDASPGKAFTLLFAVWALASLASLAVDAARLIW